jgi:hypothetical protein
MLVVRRSNGSSWLGTVLTAPDKQRPLFTRQRAFNWPCLLFRPRSPVYAQLQTFRGRSRLV